MAASRLKIVHEAVTLPAGFRGKTAFMLHNVLTHAECQSYIEVTEKKGFELALVNTGKREKKLIDVRNSSRCIWDTEEEAGIIWGRIKRFVPSMFKGRKVIGLNERLRFLRYDPGEYFKAHQDGIYVRGNGDRSYITVQLYLNQGFKGGTTTFLSNDMKEVVPVVHKTGSALVFQHDVLHEGSVIISGRKYTIRTDVMYSKNRIEKNK